MKLLYTNFHSGDGGGHTTYVRTLAAALAARHQVHVAAPPGSRLVREARSLERVHVREQPFPNGLNRWRARQRARVALRAWLREVRFDVVHVNGSADHRLVLSALRGVSARPRIVLTKHNSKPMKGVGHWWRARQTDQVIAVCEYTRQALLHTAYRHCAPTAIANGVDTNYYTPEPAPVSSAKRPEDRVATDGDLILGSTAGTAHYKGWMDLVEALALLPESSARRIHLVVAGNLPDATSTQRISALNLSSQVHFPGMLTDVRPMVAALDAGFVMSWDVETISFACREMMAMGKPVAVTDYAGLPENIIAGKDGWCVPPRDRVAMARMLESLLQQRESLPAMGAAARRHAEQSFGLQQFVDLTEQVYTHLLSK